MFPCIPHAVLKAEAFIAGHCSSKGPDWFIQRICTKNDYDLNQKFQNQEKGNYVSEVQEPILLCTQNILHYFGRGRGAGEKKKKKKSRLNLIQTF